MIRSTGSNGFGKRGCAGMGQLGTISGRLFDLLHPKIEDEHIEEIAHSLAQLNRFGGHARWPVSVAQHSCYCSDEAVRRHPKRPDFGLRLLLHDGHEGYSVDLPRPLKLLLLPLYGPIQDRIQNAIWDNFFGSRPGAKEQRAIKVIDDSVCRAEANAVMVNQQRWDWGDVEAAPINVVEWSWKKARGEFMARYHQLVERMA